MCANNNEIRLPLLCSEETLDRIVETFHKFFPDYDINDAVLYLRNNGIDAKLKDFENGELLLPIALRCFKEKIT